MTSQLKDSLILAAKRRHARDEKERDQGLNRPEKRPSAPQMPPPLSVTGHYKIKDRDGLINTDGYELTIFHKTTSKPYQLYAGFRFGHLTGLMRFCPHPSPGTKPNQPIKSFFLSDFEQACKLKEDEVPVPKDSRVGEVTWPMRWRARETGMGLGKRVGGEYELNNAFTFYYQPGPDPRRTSFNGRLSWVMVHERSCFSFEALKSAELLQPPDPGTAENHWNDFEKEWKALYDPKWHSPEYRRSLPDPADASLTAAKNGLPKLVPKLVGSKPSSRASSSGPRLIGRADSKESLPMLMARPNSDNHQQPNVLGPVLMIRANPDNLVPITRADSDNHQQSNTPGPVLGARDNSDNHQHPNESGPALIPRVNPGIQKSGPVRITGAGPDDHQQSITWGPVLMASGNYHNHQQPNKSGPIPITRANPDNRKPGPATITRAESDNHQQPNRSEPIPMARANPDNVKPGPPLISRTDSNHRQHSNMPLSKPPLKPRPTTNDHSNTNLVKVPGTVPGTSYWKLRSPSPSSAQSASASIDISSGPEEDIPARRPAPTQKNVEGAHRVISYGRARGGSGFIVSSGSADNVPARRSAPSQKNLMSRYRVILPKENAREEAGIEVSSGSEEDIPARRPVPPKELEKKPAGSDETTTRQQVISGGISPADKNVSSGSEEDIPARRPVSAKKLEKNPADSNEVNARQRVISGGISPADKNVSSGSEEDIPARRPVSAKKLEKNPADSGEVTPRQRVTSKGTSPPDNDVSSGSEEDIPARRPEPTTESAQFRSLRSLSPSNQLRFELTSPPKKRTYSSIGNGPDDQPDSKKRKRGRPRGSLGKKKLQELGETRESMKKKSLSYVFHPISTGTPVNGIKRGRGRPRKTMEGPAIAGLRDLAVAKEDGMRGGDRMKAGDRMKNGDATLPAQEMEDENDPLGADFDIDAEMEKFWPKAE